MIFYSKERCMFDNVALVAITTVNIIVFKYLKIYCLSITGYFIEFSFIIHNIYKI